MRRKLAVYMGRYCVLIGKPIMCLAQGEDLYVKPASDSKSVDGGVRAGGAAGRKSFYQIVCSPKAGSTTETDPTMTCPEFIKMYTKAYREAKATQPLKVRGRELRPWAAHVCNRC